MTTSKIIPSVIYLGEKQLTSATPLYLQENLVLKIYLGDKVVYRITKVKQ